MCLNRSFLIHLSLSFHPHLLNDDASPQPCCCSPSPWKCFCQQILALQNKIDFTGERKLPFTFERSSSVPECLDELHLKLGTGNKIEYTKLTVKSVGSKWKGENAD